MSRKKTPLDRLLLGVEKKRRLSLREFGKSDLDRTATLSDVESWYDKLSALIREKPPAERVRALRIFEDTAGRIGGVEYLYYRDGEGKDTDVIFIIETRIE